MVKQTLHSETARQSVKTPGGHCSQPRNSPAHYTLIKKMLAGGFCNLFYSARLHSLLFSFFYSLCATLSKPAADCHIIFMVQTLEWIQLLINFYPKCFSSDLVQTEMAITGTDVFCLFMHHHSGSNQPERTLMLRVTTELMLMLSQVYLTMDVKTKHTPKHSTYLSGLV